MSQTEKLTFLADKDFKKWLESEAERAGVSVSQWIISSRELVSCDKELLLKKLVKEMRNATKRARNASDRGIRDAEKTLREIQKNKEGRIKIKKKVMRGLP